MESDPNRIQTAYHEAGHACVALLTGFPVHLVTIASTGDAAGITSSHHFAIGTDDEQSVILEAGFAAEIIASQLGRFTYDPDISAQGMRADFDALERISRSESPAHWKKAVAILTKHWPFVESVAASLLTEETLSGDRLFEIADNFTKQL